MPTVEVDTCAQDWYEIPRYLVGYVGGRDLPHWEHAFTAHGLELLQHSAYAQVVMHYGTGHMDRLRNGSSYFQDIPTNAIFHHTYFGQYKTLDKPYFAKLMHDVDHNVRQYVLPDDKNELIPILSKCGDECLWVYKPQMGSGGSAVRFVGNIKELNLDRPAVVQNFVHPLLIEERKLDLRVHVLMTSINPLRIYVQPNAHVRRANAKWNSTHPAHNIPCALVTNMGGGLRRCQEFYEKGNFRCRDCEKTYNFWRGNKLLEYLDQTYGEGKGAEAWENVLSAIRHTLVAAIARGGYEHYLNVAKAWRIWGFDLTMSPDLSVWVIEMNSRPDDVNAGPNGIYKQISIVVGRECMEFAFSSLSALTLVGNHRDKYACLIQPMIDEICNTGCSVDELHSMQRTADEILSNRYFDVASPHAEVPDLFKRYSYADAKSNFSLRLEYLNSKLTTRMLEDSRIRDLREEFALWNPESD